MNSKTRRHRRHSFEPPVAANYGAFPVKLMNISVSGMQLEHNAPIKLQTPSRISIPFPRSSSTAELKGEVMWSHLSRKPDGEGKYIYLSGIRLEETSDNMVEVAKVVQAYTARGQAASAEERTQPAAAGPVMRHVHTQKAAIDADRQMLIRQVAERLRDNPAELKIHADRARSALSIRIASVVQSDVALAVWEYLQRVVPFEDIDRVLAGKS